MNIYQNILKIFVVLLLTLLTGNLSAQKTMIRVIDENTSKPCEFTNVVLLDMDGKYVAGGITDQDGSIGFDISEPMKLAVSYLGYATLAKDRP